MNNDPDPRGCYCPHCGENGELAEEVTGYFGPNTHIFRCPYCHTLIEDYHFDTVKSAY